MNAPTTTSGNANELAVVIKRIVNEDDLKEGRHYYIRNGIRFVMGIYNKKSLVCFGNGTYDLRNLANLEVWEAPDITELLRR